MNNKKNHDKSYDKNNHMNNHQNNDLLQRYLAAVGRHLPDKNREDILKELESDLLERLPLQEGEAEDNGEAQKQLEELLLAYGEPAEVGRRYGGRAECLIGADLYPLYGTVLRLVLVIGLCVLSFVYLIGLVFSPTDVAGMVRLFRDWTVALAQGALSIFATVTLSFAVAERVLRKRGETADLGSAGWKPSSLPPVPVSVDRIKPAGLIVGILFNVFFAGMLLLRPDDFGIVMKLSDIGKPVLVPILNAHTVNAFLWVMLILLVLSTVNALWKLAAGRFTVPTRILSMILAFAGAAVALIILNQPDLLDPTRGLQTMLPAGQADNLLLALRLSLRITSVAIAIPCVVEGVQHALRLGPGTVNKL